MATLRCGVEECAHNNKNNFCCKESIKVGGMKANVPSETACESFDEQKSQMTSGLNESPNPNMAIGCDVTSCIHNENQRCVSSYVDIAVGSTSAYGNNTQCSSFTEK